VRRARYANLSIVSFEQATAALARAEEALKAIRQATSGDDFDDRVRAFADAERETIAMLERIGYRALTAGLSLDARLALPPEETEMRQAFELWFDEASRRARTHFLAETTPQTVRTTNEFSLHAMRFLGQGRLALPICADFHNAVSTLVSSALAVADEQGWRLEAPALGSEPMIELAPEPAGCDGCASRTGFREIMREDVPATGTTYVTYKCPACKSLWCEALAPSGSTWSKLQ
jgi:hypothetical protein